MLPLYQRRHLMILYMTVNFANTTALSKISNDFLYSPVPALFRPGPLHDSLTTNANDGENLKNNGSFHIPVSHFPCQMTGVTHMESFKEQDLSYNAHMSPPNNQVRGKKAACM